MDPDVGKLARIAGFAVVLLGGGVVLDTEADALGLAVTAVGAVVFGVGVVRGWWARRPRGPGETP